jgi:hypothetical protein
MSQELTMEDRVKWLEKQVEELTNTLIITAEEFNKNEKKLKDVSIKFNSFAKAVLSNSDKEFSKKVFKEYQKKIFEQSK